MDLVSVIIPVYNAAPYLERCLKSIINQDYPNIEIILINDGSTDNSLSICQKYKEYYTNIRVIDQHNTGASVARKNGIDAAKGKYLTFVDSDDFVSRVYISSLYNAIVTNNAEMSICPFERVKVEDKIEHFNETATSRVIQKKELLKRFFKYEFWGFGGGCYARHLFDNVSFPEATVNEDYYVKCQMFLNANKVAYIDVPLYYYEIHQCSLSTSGLSERSLGEFDNALATWIYVSKEAPSYRNHALSIASEAACKWLGALKRHEGPKSDAYTQYERRIEKFIRHNFYQIMSNPQLLWKIKVALVLSLLK